MPRISELITASPIVTAEDEANVVLGIVQNGASRKIALGELLARQLSVDELEATPPVPPVIAPGGGTSWASQALASASYGRPVSNGAGTVIFAGGIGTDQARRSTDNGATWNNLSILPGGPTNNNRVSIAYGNGVWLAVAPRQGGNYIFRSSDNGVTWVQIYFSSVQPANQPGTVWFFDGRFFFTPYYALSPFNGSGMWYSDDNGTTLIAVGAGGALCGLELFNSSMFKANGLIVYVSMGGAWTPSYIVTSSDNGATWVLRATLAGPWSAVAYGNGRWVLHRLDSAEVIISTDGITWGSPVASNLAGAYSITFFAGVFVAARNNVASAYVSTDGVAWTTYAMGGTMRYIGVDPLYFHGAGHTAISRAPTGYTPGINGLIAIPVGTDFAVLEHAGSTQRLLAAQADGRHEPVASLVWTGAFLKIGDNDVASVGTSGLVTRTGIGQFASRSIVAPAAGITIANGDGIAGNPTLALANDLAAYEGLSATGLVARTADGAAAARTLTAGATGGVSVTNGNGVSGNPTVTLWVAAPATATSAGTVGQMAYDGSFIYICTATNTWRRAAIAAW